MEENTQIATLEKTIEPVIENGNGANGHHALSPTKSLPVAKQISNKDLIAEQQSLIEKETEIEQNYQGLSGYLRLFHVSRVIGMLALYLYLDQYDMHHAQHLKQAEAKMEIARKSESAGNSWRENSSNKSWFFSRIYFAASTFSYWK